MRNKFLSFLIVTCAFLIGVTSSAWAEEAEEDKIQPFYLVSLKAQASSSSDGSGSVQLTWVDAQGALFSNAAMAWINSDKNYTNVSQMYSDPYTDVNNPTEQAATAQVTGVSLFAAESIEDNNPNSVMTKLLRNQFNPKDNLFMTPYVYFKADAQGAPGSYLYDWTFTEAAITRQDTAMDKTHPESAYFKVLPNEINRGEMNLTNGNIDMSDARTNAQANPNNIYAVFKKYILSNPVVKNNGSVGTAEGSQATIDVSVDIEGDMSQLKENYADFYLPGMPGSVFAEDAEGAWTWNLGDTPSEVLSPVKGRANIVITYTAKAGVTAGTKRATFVAKMQGTNPSTLNIPLAVEVRPVSLNEASVTVGEVTTEYATLADAVTAANAASGDVTLTLLRDISDAVLLSNKMKLDLNSYTLSNNLVINTGADVELVYNKQGGKVTNTVAVQNGAKLTLNGGTIEVSGIGHPTDLSKAVVAVNVANGGKLIQNGANISATALYCYAIGINVDGEVEVKDGSVTAHAGMTAAFAAQVSATGKLTTSGGALNASVDQSHNPSANPADQSTWSNAYAVYVAKAAGEANLQGGTFYSTSSYSGAFAVSAIASFGKLTIGKNAVVSAHTVSSDPVAYAVGCMGSANLTVNGGRFSATYTNQAKACPPFLCAAFDKLDFKAGIIKADSVFVRAGMFPATMTLVQPKLYSVVKGSQDYIDGYRYIAVADNANPAEFVPACRIGSTGYPSLKAALSYANNYPEEELIIFMLRDEVLPAGYYTLPKKATLVIPMSDSQAKEANLVCPRVVSNDVNRIDYEVPTEFRRLTFASGVNMEVHGQIEMTGTQFSTNTAYNSYPHGPYGRLVMEEGSHMTLSEGAELRAWGYMTGKGETDARRGATVREMFQMGDWKGAFTSVAITGLVPSDFPVNVGDYSDKKIFPVTQYFIQNVESPVKYHPGAVLSTCAAVSEGVNLGNKINIAMAAPDIKIIGLNEDDEAIFLMDRGADADNTWVRKWYDVDRDVQTYEINSGANIGSMVIDMKELSLMGYTLPVKLNSAKFDLPITNNMKIHLLSGSMGFEQNTCLLPGANVEVDKEARVTVSMSDEEYEAKQNNEDRVYYTGALYVFGKEDWDTYAYDPEGSTYTKVVNYSPSWADKGAENGRPTVRLDAISDPTQFNDTAIFVHGTFDTKQGYVYSSEHAVNIYSTDADAGTFIFSDDASEAGERTVYQINGIGNSQDQYIPITFTSVKLRNGNGEAAPTEDAKKDDAYCYMDGKWTILKVVDGNYCFMKDNYDTYYAKPSEYVALNATMDNNNKIVGNEDHTYSDANGAGRLFILKDNGCQWWEVVLKDSLYYCEKNDMYYYYDNSEKDWMEKKCKITWKNYNDTIIPTANSDGTLVNSYYVPYGTIAEFNGLANPTRANDIDSTHSFVGWQPELGKVTGDVTYTAVFSASPREYTITFCESGGKLIESHLVPYGEVPVCENTPSDKDKMLQWSPALQPVVGTQTYTATWIEELPETYPVSFVNNDGTLLKKADGVEDAVYDVRLDAEPSSIYDGAEPEKAFTSAAEKTELTKENVYTFTGWRAIIDGEARDFAQTDVLPAPTAPTIYTAQYSSQRRTYTIKFVKENGDPAVAEDVLETLELPYGATPLCSKTPTKPNTDEWSYSFAWTPQIQTVVGDANYTATFTPTKNKYTLTLRSNNDAVCTFAGAGIFEYGKENLAVSATIGTGYKFSRWEGDADVVWSDATHGVIANLTHDITLTLYVVPDAGTSDKIVGNGETLDIMSLGASDRECKDFVLNSNGETSAQVSNIDKLTIWGAAYYDLSISNPTDRTWYSVAVPWAVDATTGIYAKNGSSSRRLVLGSDFDIIYYNGACRAAGGEKCWDYLEDQSDKTMQPGKAYMIAFHSTPQTVRFQRANRAPLLNTTVTVEQHPSADPAKANWNGVANPALYYAYLNAGTPIGQCYTAGRINQETGERADGYTPVTMNSNKLIVGQPVYVQAPEAKTVVVNSSSYAAAPRRRMPSVTDTRFTVEIAQNGYQYDRIYLQTDDEKEDRYVIGQDLAKMGVSSKVAQMWVDRYGSKLCLNTMASVNDIVTYPLGIFAPIAGEYTIYIASQPDDDNDLYVTLDGTPVWNLSNGAYTVSLEKGTTTRYGLRISAKTPQVTTGTEEVDAEKNDAVQKILIDNQIYIIRENRVYTIDGQLVK